MDTDRPCTSGKAFQSSSSLFREIFDLERVPHESIPICRAPLWLRHIRDKPAMRIQISLLVACSLMTTASGLRRLQREPSSLQTSAKGSSYASAASFYGGTVVVVGSTYGNLFGDVDTLEEGPNCFVGVLSIPAMEWEVKATFEDTECTNVIVSESSSHVYVSGHSGSILDNLRPPSNSIYGVLLDLESSNLKGGTVLVQEDTPTEPMFPVGLTSFGEQLYSTLPVLHRMSGKESTRWIRLILGRRI